MAGQAQALTAMIDCPNVLLIGAADRNVGKTEFACRIIARVARCRPVVGVKVTPVRERGSGCPRGGAGCGACATLREPYCIAVEADPGGDKDTCRMLRAGASRVLWLRAMAEHLESGLRELLARIPRDAVVVCESNTARQFLRPGLFLLLRAAGDGAVPKPSAAAVLPLADRVIAGGPEGWELAPDAIVLAGERWVVQPQATAVILAGGGSRRMGMDKGLLDAGGQPLIERIAAQLAFFPEVLISANETDKYAFLGLPVVPDRQAGQGPLMGILSALDRAAYELCFVTGCDIPHLDPGFVLDVLAQAEGCDIAMPRHADGRLEPLLAAYRRSIRPTVASLLAGGVRRIAALLDRVRVRYVPFAAPAWYHDLNTREEYEQWLAGTRSRG